MSRRQLLNCLHIFLISLVTYTARNSQLDLMLLIEAAWDLKQYYLYLFSPLEISLSNLKPPVILRKLIHFIYSYFNPVTLLYKYFVSVVVRVSNSCKMAQKGPALILSHTSLWVGSGNRWAYLFYLLEQNHTYKLKVYSISLQLIEKIYY